MVEEWSTNGHGAGEGDGSLLVCCPRNAHSPPRGAPMRKVAQVQVHVTAVRVWMAAAALAAGCKKDPPPPAPPSPAAALAQAAAALEQAGKTMQQNAGGGQPSPAGAQQG